MSSDGSLTMTVDQISLNDVARVGGKNAASDAEQVVEGLVENGILSRDASGRICRGNDLMW